MAKEVRPSIGCWLLFLFASLAKGAVCPLGSEVRYFYANNYVKVGNPPIGRIRCAAILGALPSTCAFFKRTDSGGADESSITFNATPFGYWPCGSSGASGRKHNCWYTSTVTYGPDNSSHYVTADGVRSHASMVFAGQDGAAGACDSKATDCGTTTYSCGESHILRNGEVAGPAGCQQRFCNPTAFSSACCASKCSIGYGANVGACPRGTFGGSYANSCAGHRCNVTDRASCCEATTTCASNDAVEVFGSASTGNFIDIGDPPTGKVHCVWSDINTPPSRCPYYPRVDNGGADVTSLLLGNEPSGTVNCAREGGVGTRYCWHHMFIKEGPDVFGAYKTTDGISGLPWYTLYREGANGWAACHQNGFNCGTRVYSCAEASLGAVPKPGKVAGLSGCQSQYCEMNSFVAGCCITTTTTSIAIVASPATLTTTGLGASTISIATSIATAASTTVFTGTTTTSTTTIHACAAGTEVRYFWGGNYVYVGSPVLGRIHCAWPSDMSATPSTCPFFPRADSGGADQSSMSFRPSPLGHWPCSGPAAGGLNNHCWYTSTIQSGPDSSNKYATANGGKADWYMTFIGSTGSGGRCPPATPPTTITTTTTVTTTTTRTTTLTTTGVPCAVGTDVRYFYGGNSMQIGNPVIGRLQCIWPASGIPSTCPFYQRSDGGGADQSAMTFSASASAQWTCQGPGKSQSTHCWYSSTIAAGPDASGRYRTSDGSITPYYMVFGGQDGSRGQCHASYVAETTTIV